MAGGSFAAKGELWDSFGALAMSAAASSILKEPLQLYFDLTPKHTTYHSCPFLTPLTPDDVPISPSKEEGTEDGESSGRGHLSSPTLETPATPPEVIRDALPFICFSCLR